MNQEITMSENQTTTVGVTTTQANTCREYIGKMPDGFRSQAAGGLAVVYQFEISGAEEFTVHLQIAAGSCTLLEGSHVKPDVAITSPADIWLAIARKEMNAQLAYMTGKFKVRGDIGLLLKLKELFGNG